MFAYICCDAGVVVVSLIDPKCPQVVAIINEEFVREPVAVQVQFRYAYICDADGLKVFDVTDLERPRYVTSLRLADVHNVYLARTYAYVAAGAQGLVIVDITNPEKPFIDQIYNAGGCLNQVHDVKLGITYVSEFAYIADGCNGMKRRFARASLAS